ncbi:hypothetical protein AgCh_012243 [Apium graveolens]
MVYRNFKKGRRFSRKGSSSSNSDKRNNKRDTDWKESRSRKPEKSKDRYSDDGINYAFMENADAETNTAELKGDRRNALVLDSECSRHMIGYKSLLSEFEEKDGPRISYGDGNLGKILGYGKIKVGNERCEIVSKSDGKITLTGVRHGSLYEARVSTRTDNSEKAKQRKTSFKSKTKSLILEPYHLLYVDLFGPVNVMSIAKKKYALVIVDEFTRYTWVYFLHTKDGSLSILLDHVRELEKGSTYKIKIIRSDNGTEFKNSSMEEFCKLKGVKQEFSAPGTPQ